MEFKPTSNIIESKQSQNLALDSMYDRVSGVSRDSLPLKRSTSFATAKLA